MIAVDEVPRNAGTGEGSNARADACSEVERAEIRSDPMALGSALVSRGRGRGIVFRIGGSSAIRMRCRAGTVTALRRDAPGDLDLFAYWRQRDAVADLLTALGYLPDPAIAASLEYGVKRHIYHDPGPGAKVEVFFDELKMSHTVELGDRLEIDEWTLTLADLLLSKLQIHDLAEKDLQDIWILLSDHKIVSEGVGGDGIDVRRITTLTRGDWGLHHSATTTLDQARAYGDALTGRLPNDTLRIVAKRIDDVIAAMDDAPKTLPWRLRAKLGQRARWYEEVGDVER